MEIPLFSINKLYFPFSTLTPFLYVTIDISETNPKSTEKIIIQQKIEFVSPHMWPTLQYAVSTVSVTTY